MFTINGHNYYPAQFTVTIEDLDHDAGRDENTGAMKRNRIAIKRTLAITMPPMVGTDADNLLRDIGGVSFNVTYYDPYEAGRVTKTFYPGNRTCTMYYENTQSIGVVGASGLPYDVLWESISFDLVEM